VRAVDATLEHLKRAGVTAIFGLPGGPVIPLFDALHDDPDIRTYLVRHEQGAGHMAEGYAKVTGRVGVCTATSGPGATNLVTPIADAYMDSVPLVAITGQVGASRVGTDAFQEADIVGITLPIVKHSYLIKDAAELPQALAEALHGEPELANAVLEIANAPALARGSRFAAVDRAVAVLGKRAVVEIALFVLADRHRPS